MAKWMLGMCLFFALLLALPAALGETAEDLLRQWMMAKDPGEAAQLFSRYRNALLDMGETYYIQGASAKEDSSPLGLPADPQVGITLKQLTAAQGGDIDAMMADYVGAVAREVAAIRALPNWQELFPPPPATINPLFQKHGDILRKAFAFLDGGNPLIARFNRLNGEQPDAFSPYPYGLPYLWAGKRIQGDPMRITYIAEYSGETKMFKFGRAYLEGFDCSGYIDHIYEGITGQRKPLPSITEMLKDGSRHVEIGGTGAAAFRWLRVGDLFVCSDWAGGTSHHVLMYIGTLYDYGYRADGLPALKDYLDYPLVIHCSTNNFQPRWFARYIEESQIAAAKGVPAVFPPDGGVMVSIIGVPPMAATKVEPLITGTRNVYSFDLEGYELTIFPLFDKSDYAVYRP